jgi:hypothetical protein
MSSSYREVYDRWRTDPVALWIEQEDLGTHWMGLDQFVHVGARLWPSTISSVIPVRAVTSGGMDTDG